MVKEFLSRAGQTFELKNIQEDDKAYDELLALGARSVPVTLIAGRMITGFDQAQLRSALADAGAPPSADR
jgi:glutaredoxin